MNYYGNDLLHDKKILILQQLINIIPEIGFNQLALILATQNANLHTNYWKIIFPHGLPEVASSIELYFDQLMIDKLNDISTTNTISNKVVTALQLRIKLVPQSVVSTMLRFYMLPSNHYLAINNAWHSCNSIWIYMHDRSLDFNYYSKRSLLMLCYISTMIYYTNDNSNNFSKTDFFAADLIAKISNIAKLKHKIKSLKFDDIPILRFLYNMIS